MEKITDFKQLALKDIVYISWEYKSFKNIAGDNGLINKSEWLLGRINKINKNDKKYPIEVVCLSCSSGALIDVGKMISLTATMLQLLKSDIDDLKSFRYKEFNKLTKSEAAVHMI